VVVEEDGGGGGDGENSRHGRPGKPGEHEGKGRRDGGVVERTEEGRTERGQDKNTNPWQSELQGLGGEEILGDTS
jgi:hypothetical protein